MCRAVVTWSVAQETKALKLVQDLLEEFVNMSFGDTTFAKFVVLIMQQAFPVDLRLEMYRNDRFLELCTVDTTGMGSGGMHGFLHPRETHLECVELQAMALLGYGVSGLWNETCMWVEHSLQDLMSRVLAS